MDITTIITAVIACAGTLIVQIVGISKSNSLTAYKIDRLTEKVHEHNNVIKRTYELEKKSELAAAEFRRINHRLEELEEKEQ